MSTPLHSTMSETMQTSSVETMVGDSAARLFSQHVNRALLEQFEAGVWPARLWQLAEDNGLTLALASEASGGIGASWREAYPILRGIGYWHVPLPLAGTMIAALLLSRAGIVIPAGPISLIDTADGGTVTADAGADAADGAGTGAGTGAGASASAAANGAGMRLTGSATRVAWASQCRSALVSLADGRIALLDLKQGDAVHITTHLNPAGEPCDEVRLRNALCLAHAANPFPTLAQPLRTLGAIASSAMMVGAMEWLLEQSVQYANDRVQFGKPIGKNQAIQQQLALMAGDVAAARMAAMVACADAPGAAASAGESGAGDACPAAYFSAAVAKVRAGEAATRATSIAHQVHGAIGFTYEHSLNFATRRLWAWREIYGADAWWAQRLGEAAMAAGAEGFWPALTRRHF